MLARGRRECLPRSAEESQNSGGGLEILILGHTLLSRKYETGSILFCSAWALGMSCVAFAELEVEVAAERG